MPNTPVKRCEGCRKAKKKCEIDSLAAIRCLRCIAMNKDCDLLFYQESIVPKPQKPLMAAPARGAKDILAEIDCLLFLQAGLKEASLPSEDTISSIGELPSLAEIADVDPESLGYMREAARWASGLLVAALEAASLELTNNYNLFQELGQSSYVRAIGTLLETQEQYLSEKIVQLHLPIQQHTKPGRKDSVPNLLFKELKTLATLSRPASSQSTPEQDSHPGTAFASGGLNDYLTAHNILRAVISRYGLEMNQFLRSKDRQLGGILRTNQYFERISPLMAIVAKVSKNNPVVISQLCGLPAGLNILGMTNLIGDCFHHMVAECGIQLDSTSATHGRCVEDFTACKNIYGLRPLHFAIMNHQNHLIERYLKASLASRGNQYDALVAIWPFVDRFQDGLDIVIDRSRQCSLWRVNPLMLAILCRNEGAAEYFFAIPFADNSFHGCIQPARYLDFNGNHAGEYCSLKFHLTKLVPAHIALLTAQHDLLRYLMESPGPGSELDIDDVTCLFWMALTCRDKEAMSYFIRLNLSERTIRKQIKILQSCNLLELLRAYFLRGRFTNEQDYLEWCFSLRNQKDQFGSRYLLFPNELELSYSTELKLEDLVDLEQTQNYTSYTTPEEKSLEILLIRGLDFCPTADEIRLATSDEPSHQPILSGPKSILSKKSKTSKTSSSLITIIGDGGLEILFTKRKPKITDTKLLELEH
ncbi:hypothetical protein H072_10618 [Dactylellina haptotyla CBS 200.50]|uniref:Zn(2)-C6 fungal-type domain-containing protein n=1 Tax=Dactylellina haptotyla (strain CBS 200.50) TaxID=1284197 RepID=S7ZZS0_DACHA|nr:hypothetical protein H072_10618 [Dactylellina haptotyla CBS 200.50]